MSYYVFINHVSEIWGAEKSMLELIKNLKNKSDQPILACPSGMLSQAARTLKIPWVKIDLGRMKRNYNPWYLIKCGLKVINARREIERRLKEKPIRRIHCNSLVSMLVGVPLARRWRVPLVWHVRDWPKKTWYWRWLAQCATQIIAVSFAVAKEISQKNKIIVIPNYVCPLNTPRQQQIIKLKKENMILEKEICIGIFGQLVPWKGHADFIYIAEKALKMQGNLKFIIVGADLFNDHRKYVEQLENMIGSRGLEQKVLWIGYQSEVSPWMHLCDIVVSCSQNEPFGRSLVEAVLCQKPVVAYRSGGHPEVVGSQGQGGQLIETGNLDAFASALIKLAKDKRLRLLMGKKAAKWARTQFASEKYKLQLRDWYQGLLDGE